MEPGCLRCQTWISDLLDFLETPIHRELLKLNNQYSSTQSLQLRIGTAMQPSLHKACEPLAVMVGDWRGSGIGHYPGIEEFEYLEEIAFGHVGKPFLTYSQKTKKPSDRQPLHSEQGFLRVIDDKTLEMVVAQPTGITEVHNGFYAANPTSCVVNLESIQVVTTVTAKPVEQVRRLLRIENNTLTYDLSMAAVGKPMQHHLEASLQRVKPE